MHKILKKELKLSKVAAKFVPRLLDDRQKQVWIDACKELLQMCEDDDLFLDKLVTGDESWCYAYDLETKKESSQWIDPKRAPRLQKALRARSTKKSMLTVFWDAYGIINAEFARANITAKSYLKTLANVREQVRRKRPGLWEIDEQTGYRILWLQHDNAKPHMANPVVARLEETHVRCVTHPPYSPDLTPSDFFLFPHLKAVLRGWRFPNVPTLEGQCKQS